MPRFRARLQHVEAVQWLGDMTSVRALLGYEPEAFVPHCGDALRIITTGEQCCRRHDWIVRQEHGYVAVVGPDAFAAQYEPA